ncbi:MAG: alanine--tRNA ligase [Candidatus Tagabacteria bacterium]
MSSEELRKKFLEFFKSKGHAIIPGSSLIPEHDPTVLFTTAGMHPLVPYLLGEKHPAGKRLVDVQKCVRTSDIDEVGDNWHVTFLEMLGNWSLGDPASPDGVGAGYWKKEAIEWSFEFLTSDKWLGLDKNKIAISVFIGDDDAPFDREAFDIWKNNIGIPEKKIAKLPKENNWWGPAGQTGPCGPCTEMFYWMGEPEEPPEIFDADNPLWLEFWNDVFMQYNKNTVGEFEPLKQKNVDTGMGLERMIAVLNGQSSVYETELFQPIIMEIKKIAKIPDYLADSFDKLYNPGQAVAKEIAGLEEKAEKERAVRIISDHIKAATFILAEGLEPSNVERGYVLRRLIRRAVRYGKQLGINDIFTFKVAKIIIEIYKDIYPELSQRKNFIEEQLVREEEKFVKTLERGLKNLKSQISNLKSKNVGKISGEIVFNLYQTYGFPLELTEELAKEESFLVDTEEFQKLFAKHQKLSRTATAGTFKSGLADHSEQVIKYHTASHLMLMALRKVLGEYVAQKGSNITAERLRFDFSHSEKMTPEQIKQVEDLVNQKIQEDLPVQMEEMSLEEAKKQGAMGVFESKYGEKVKVYTIGQSAQGGHPFSREICGGPHAERTGILGKFKILKEESSSAGVRRIKAVLE